MEHPKDVGDRSTLAIMLALRSAGYALFVPFGENTRCDLIVEVGQRLARVQCKTGRLRKGAVRFAVCSCYGHHARPGDSRRHYHGQVDYFAVYCPDTGGVYLVPIADLPVRVQAALRVDSPRNHQERRVRFAAQYELTRITLARDQQGFQARTVVPEPGDLETSNVPPRAWTRSASSHSSEAEAASAPPTPSSDTSTPAWQS